MSDAIRRPVRASERQRASGRQRPAWPGNAMNGVAGTTPVRQCSALVAAWPQESTRSTMVIALDRDVPAPASPATAGASTFAELRPAYCLLGAPLAAVIAGAALAIAAADGPSAVEIVRPILVVLWAAAGLLLGLRRRRERLAPIVLGGALVGAVGTLAAAMLAHRALDGSAAVGLGRHPALRRRAASGDRPAPAARRWSTVAWRRRSGATRCSPATPSGRRSVSVCSPTGSTCSSGRSSCSGSLPWASACTPPTPATCKAGAEDRRRMQWIGWGMAVAAEAAVVVVALRLLIDWPDDAGAVALALTGFVPVGLGLRDAAADGRPGRSPAHPHRRPRRADGARRRHLRRRHPRPRPHPDRMTNAHCCCCRWSPPDSPRCSTCPLGAG